MYELPHEQLVRLLAESKREGLDFARAWDRAMRPGRRMVLSNTQGAPVDCVRWPTDSSERGAWLAALRELREVFRRAYQDRPMTTREEAAVKLALVLDAGDRLERAHRYGGASLNRGGGPRGIAPLGPVRSIA